MFIPLFPTYDLGQTHKHMGQSEMWAALCCVGAVVGSLAFLCSGKRKKTGVKVDKDLLCYGVKQSVEIKRILQCTCYLCL